MLRRDLLRLRNAAGPLVEVCNRLEHTQLVPIDKEMQPHFRDVTDHVRRVSADIDASASVIPSYLPKPHCAPTRPKQHDRPTPLPTAWSDGICRSIFRSHCRPPARTRDR